jgi:hypothetical protein
VSHFISSELNGAWSVAFGLAAWSLAYWFLTRVITPDCIGDLMTLIAAVLPFFSIFIALAVMIASFVMTPPHNARGAAFGVVTALALVATCVQYRDSDIRKALKKTAERQHPFRSTIALIVWGLIGAILVFASELGLIFGGWQLVQGSNGWGCGSAGTGAVLVFFGWVGGDDPNTKNPIRRAVLALKGKDQDRSILFIKRLLAPALSGESVTNAKSSVNPIP